jgi:hypothetical protein
MIVKTGKRILADLKTKDNNTNTLVKSRLAKKVKKTCLKSPYSQGYKFTLYDKKRMNEILSEAFANLTPEVITTFLITLKRLSRNIRRRTGEDFELAEVENVEEVITDVDCEYIFDKNIKFF